jgi:hypothetical protein
MKDWFDEWLNSPNHNEHLPTPPNDLDRDGLYQDSRYYEQRFDYEQEPDELNFAQQLLYIAFSSLVYAIIGLCALLLATTAILLIIAVIINNQLAQWAAVIALATLALHWSKKGQAP